MHACTIRFLAGKFPPQSFSLQARTGTSYPENSILASVCGAFQRMHISDRYTKTKTRPDNQNGTVGRIRTYDLRCHKPAL